MSVSVIQTRIDTELKDKAENFFRSMGLDLTTAVRLFICQSLIQGKIPFEIKPDEKVIRGEAKALFEELRNEASGLQEMSLDEINAEIQAVRDTRAKYK